MCGKIVGIYYVWSGKGQPTFIHFDEQYPNQIFTMVIWESDRPKFGRRSEETCRDKAVYVTGKITNTWGSRKSWPAIQNRSRCKNNRARVLKAGQP